MADDNTITKMSEDNLTRILEYLYKNGNKYTSVDSIKNDLFPEMDNNVFRSLFTYKLFVGIKPITVSMTGDVIERIVVYDGLGELVKNRKKQAKKEKLHRIVEFLSTDSERTGKGEYESDEISKAFSPVLSISEVNNLCRILVNEGDVRDCSSKTNTFKKTICLRVITETHDAYNTKKYLQEDDLVFNVPTNQNIFNSDNIAFVGRDNYGNIEQEVKTELPKKGTKPKWLKIVGWILGLLLVILGIIEAIIQIVKLKSGIP
jgi:hypothetical protein